MKFLVKAFFAILKLIYSARNIFVAILKHQ
nr:MAG TPA: hypothetical protein [Caudoviricetes sp.]